MTAPSPPCRRCELLPESAPAPGEGRLFLWPAVDHLRGRLTGLLTRHGRAFEAPAEGPWVAVPLDAAGHEACLAELDRGLSSAEARDTKALFVPGRRGEPGLHDLPRVADLAALIARARGRWLIDLLAERRLRTVFQPILDGRDGVTPFAVECLLRGVDHDGREVAPGRMFAAARDGDLLFHLDREARVAAVRGAAATGWRGAIFINFTPSALYDPAACLRTTLRAVHETGLRPERIVFEVVETDRIDDVGHLGRILEFYRAKGFRVALDDLGAGYSSLNLVPRLRPDFIKIDRELVSGVDGDPYKRAVVRTIVNLARGLNIRVIAEGVERAEEFARLREDGVDYVQGFLFAPPSACAPGDGAPPSA